MVRGVLPTIVANETHIHISALAKWRSRRSIPLVSALALLASGAMTAEEARAQQAEQTVPSNQAAKPAGDVLLLAPVNVEGAVPETAYSPVDGYVASRSGAGTKTDTPIIETPQSVSVISRDEIEARGARNLGEALSYTAGASTGSRGESTDFGGNNIRLRGFGGDGTLGTSYSEYADGLRLQGTNFLGAAYDPYMYERIDILKGPASVLYGQGIPGGIINSISRRPADEFGGEIQFQVGNFDRRQGAFDVTGPVDADKKLLYRLTGLYLDTETQTDFMERQRIAVAPALTWRPTVDTTLTLLTSYQHDEIEKGSGFNWVPAYGSVLPNVNGEISRDFNAGEPGYDRWDRSSYSIGYLFEHRIDETWTVRQNFRYQRHELDFQAVYVNGLAADQRTLSRQAFRVEETADHIAVDNQVQAKFNTGAVQHTALAGVDYSLLRSDTLRGIGSPVTLDLFNPVYGRAAVTTTTYQSIFQRRNQLGTYLQEQVKYGGWNLMLGGRKDWAETKTRNRLNNATSTQDDTAFTGRAGLLYLFDSGFAPYVSYSESFEPVSGTDYNGSSFKPTRGRQVEGGVKFQPKGYNSFISAALFNLTQENVTTSDPVNTGYSVQTGEVRSRGFELEGKASLDEGLDLLVAYTYLDMEVTKSNGADLGKVPVAVPKQQASLWSNYTFQDGTLKGLGIGAGVRYVGATWGDTTNTFKVPSYTLADAAIQYDLGALSSKMDGVKLAVNANNLFDREYVGSCTRLTACYYGTGRTVIGSLKYQW